jgi:hypothetical protein
VPAPDAPAARARITIVEATSIFIANRESAQLAPATLRKYRTFTKQLTAYADGRGCVMIDQFTPADADQFYAGLKLGPRTKGTRLGVLRAFFRFAVNRKWMSETPISADIRPPSVPARAPTRCRSGAFQTGAIRDGGSREAAAPVSGKGESRDGNRTGRQPLKVCTSWM